MGSVFGFCGKPASESNDEDDNDGDIVSSP